MRPVQDPTEIVLLDGVARDPAAAVLPAGWPGVLRGEGIFEAFRVDDGVPTPFLDRHQRRLEGSARRCDFALDGLQLERELEELLPVLDPRGPWRLRFTLLRRADGGLARLWTVGRAPPSPTSMVLAVAELRLDPRCPLAGAKTDSRMGYQLARHRARAVGADEALVRTLDGDLGEGTSTNLFLVIGGALHTAGLDRGILAGITRGALLEACREAEIPCFEREIGLEELSSAEEIYVTSAVIGVVPATRIMGYREALPGPEGVLLPEVRAAYSALRARLSPVRTSQS